MKSLSLSISVPPSTPTIFDERGQEVRGRAGPYLPGSSVVLKCISVGGDPAPEMTWWRDSHLVDSTYEATYSRTVQNTIAVERLTRADLGAQFTCQAANNNISLPATAKVTLDMKCEYN